MKIRLESEIKYMVATLRKEGKMNLAEEIERNWNKTILEYSKSINSYLPDRPIDDLLKEALRIELSRLNFSKKEAENIVNYLEKNRTIQTGPHVSPAGKPRYFFINWLASLSLSAKQYFIVAMFSGVPFSNKTRPGRLCSKEGEINLIPSSMQDELVYRNKIPIKMIEVLQNLPENLKKLLPLAKEGGSYTHWALKSAEMIEGDSLHGKPVFIDFNEVASNYLRLAICDPKHPISKMLFSEKERKMTIKNFKEMIFFYSPVQKGNYEEMDSFFLKNGYLESSNRKIPLNPEVLAKELEGRLCPGLITGFLIFSFLNHFQCLGSFAQIEYLPLYRDKFAKFPFLKKYNISKAKVGLTTGGFPFNPNLHALDIALGEQFEPNEDLLFGETLVAIKDILLNQNYSMNLVRR